MSHFYFNFISIYAEGLDFEIINSLDFNKYRPALFCIETVNFSNNAKSEKRKDILNIMNVNNNEIFADTYVNTIFVDSKI